MTDGPFTAAGRAIDEFLAGLASAICGLAQLVVEAEEFAELGRNPYTALAVIEDRVRADADLKFAFARWRLHQDEGVAP